MRLTSSVWLLCTLCIIACGDSAPVNGDSAVDVDNDGPTADVSADSSSDSMILGDTSIDVGDDGFVIPDGGFPLRNEFVVNNVTVPVTSAEAAALGFDLDGDENPDNALGFILALLANQSGAGGNLGQGVNEAVHRGDLLALLRFDSIDLVNSPAELKGFSGQQTMCCANPEDPPLCMTQSQTTCFSGSSNFTTTNASGFPFTANIVGGVFDSSVGSYEIFIPLGAGVLVPLEAARFTGTLSPSGDQITAGRLGGALSQTTLNTQVIPALAVTLNDTIAMGGPDAQTVLNLFDDDNNGSISVAEISNNALIGALLAGDVDVDGDQVNELSIAFGFTAVGATILAP